MPNYCFNHLKLVGPRADIQDILLHELRFSHYVPVRDDNDTDERREAWGTRSEPLDLEMNYSNQDPNCLNARFMTAWSPPTVFLKKLLDIFPSVWMKLEFDIEGGLGTGLWILWQENGLPIEKCMLWQEPVFDEDGT